MVADTSFAATCLAPMRKVGAGGDLPGVRLLAEEAAVAITFNHATHAVMLATPADLADFAIGFSLAEGIIADAGEILGLEIVGVAGGIEARVTLASDRAAMLSDRQRRMAGASGCGLCGVESLSAALPALPKLPVGEVFSAAQVMAAMAAMHPAQVLNRQTHAVHAAGLWQAEAGLTVLREDIGRHNALDKLRGALAQLPANGAGMVGGGIVTLTSRVSIELVQKAARMGAPLLAAMSAPTAHAVRLADACGMTLVAVARDDGFEVFCGFARIT